MIYLLDTSALLAFLLNEPGAGRVAEILADPGATTGISVLTAYEVATVAFARTRLPEDAEKALANAEETAGSIWPLDPEVLGEAVALRVATSGRVATVDLLIAATASHHGATLIHRDPHFAALPADRPKQETLPPKLSA